MLSLISQIIEKLHMSYIGDIKGYRILNWTIYRMNKNFDYVSQEIKYFMSEIDF